MQSIVEIIQREHKEFLVYSTGLQTICGMRVAKTKEIPFTCGNCSYFRTTCAKIGVSKLTGTSLACDEFKLSEREENALLR